MWYIFLVDSILAAGISIFLLGYFYQMITFFIKVLDQSYEINAYWSKLYIIIVMSILGLFIFRDYLLVQIAITSTRMFKMLDFETY